MLTENIYTAQVQEVQPHCAPNKCIPTNLRNLDVINNEGTSHFPSFAQKEAGLITSRMSVKLLDEVVVDFCQLTDEYSSTSKIPGKRGKEVGRGATAIVKRMCRRGVSTETQYVAVKEFRRRKKHETELEYEQKAKTEFSIAVKLDHPNIIKTLRLCHDAGRWSHVMEYCPYGDLYSLVRKKYFKEQDKLCLSKQLLQGLAYLHENGIAHRDIKLENVLLSEKGHIKIVDFGLCEIFEEIHPILQSHSSSSSILESVTQTRISEPGVCGSLPYMAPEILAQKEFYDPRAADLWSYGIVCFALWHQGTPWKAATPEDSNYSGFLSGWEQRPESTSPIRDTLIARRETFFSSLKCRSIRKLFLQMLHPIPEKRPTARYALNDRGMKSVDCCCDDPMEKNQELGYFDAARRGSRFEVAKMAVQTIHNHIPPRKVRWTSV